MLNKSVKTIQDSTVHITHYTGVSQGCVLYFSISSVNTDILGRGFGFTSASLSMEGTLYL
jgi:hypothetical protein